MSNKFTLTLVLVAAFLLATNVKAEYVVLESSFGYYQTAVDPGYGNYVTVSAQESADGKGVTFVFGLDSEYSGGTMQMQSKGNGAGVLRNSPQIKLSNCSFTTTVRLLFFTFPLPVLEQIYAS